MTKQDLLKLIEALPEDAPFAEMAAEMEKFQLRAKVLKGLKQLDEGKSVPHEEVKRKVAEWLKR